MKSVTKSHKREVKQVKFLSHGRKDVFMPMLREIFLLLANFHEARGPGGYAEGLGGREVSSYLVYTRK